MYASMLALESLLKCFGSKRSLIITVFPPSFDLGEGMSPSLVSRHPRL